MMVGHAMLAFALAASAVAARGWQRERALAFGVVAGAFAVVPDVDMLHAVFGIVQWTLVSGPTGSGIGVLEAAGAFWGRSVVVHRAVTHSLVLAGPVALAVAWSTSNRRRQLGAATLVLACTVASYLASGPLGATTLVAFAAAGVAVALVVASRTDLSESALFAAAFFGFASHPFGDLFTGTPPHVLYPFDATLFGGRVTLLPDPTLNLLAIFALELATIWLALRVYCLLTDHALWAGIDRRATLGVAYAVAAVALPAPTLDMSYHFVFSVLAVGLVVATPQARAVRPCLPDGDCLLRVAATGLAAITLATAAYTAAYLVSYAFL